MNKFELAEASSSDADSEKSPKPKTRKTAESGNTSSDDSSNNEDEELYDSSNIADWTRAKLSQQAEDEVQLNKSKVSFSFTYEIFHRF